MIAAKSSSKDQPPVCPSCGVVATRRKECPFQRIRDLPVAGSVEVLWSKYRWHVRNCARGSRSVNPPPGLTPCPLHGGALGPGCLRGHQFRPCCLPDWSGRPGVLVAGSCVDIKPEAPARLAERVIVQPVRVCVCASCLPEPVVVRSLGNHNPAGGRNHDGDHNAT